MGERLEELRKAFWGNRIDLYEVNRSSAETEIGKSKKNQNMLWRGIGPSWETAGFRV